MDITAFFFNVALVVITGLFTYLLVPLILKVVDARKQQEQKEIDDRKMREQKMFEAELARQSKIIDAQAKFLEDISLLLWDLLLSSNKVVYYAIEEKDPEGYKIAAKNYDESSWISFLKIRAEISKARR